MNAINWQSIDTHNMHGIQAIVGTRVAQVVQCYEGEWATFLKLGGHTCKPMQTEPRYQSYQAARRRATDFLLGRITPDIWPQGCCGA